MPTSTQPARAAVSGVLLAAFVALAIPARAALPADDDWIPDYHHAGVQGTVSAMLSRPGEVIVAGAIVAVGDLPVRNVARLVMTDGIVTSWSALGDGFDNSVMALVEHDGQVVAGGYFNRSGSTTVQRVARWDGAAWQPLGNGLPGIWVNSLASFGGDLYAGAYRWDGATWTNVLQVNGAVRTLVVHDGLLYVGGDFTTARGDSVAHAFAWDGVQVIPLADGLPTSVTDGVAMPDGVVFATDGGSGLGNMDRWDGQAWVNLARNISVQSMAADDSRLIVSEWYGVGGHLNIPWTGTLVNGAWSAIGSFTSGAMVVHEGRLFAQASSGTTDGVVSPGLVAWDGLRLQPPFVPDGGFDGGYGALLPVGGGVIVGGDFHIAEGAAFDGIGLASESAWTPMGRVSDLAPHGVFIDLAMANGTLYGICAYQDYDVTPHVMGRLAWVADHWQWQPFAAGTWPASLEVIGQDLYVIGYDSVTRVYPYNNVQVDLPGLDLDRSIYGSCVHMGDLVLCGDFNANAGVACGHVIRRVGDVWQDLGSPPGSAFVDEVASMGSEGLVATYRTSWVSTSRVAVYDGAQWTDLAGAFNNYIARLVVHRGRLFAGGGFTRVGDVDAAGIAMWTGSRWTPVGSGLAGGYAPVVADMESTPAGLWICGDFTTAGGRPSVGIGRWVGDPDHLAEVSAAPPVVPAAGRLLKPAQPNPFNPRTELTLALPAAGEASLSIYDARGALVKRLLDAMLEAGEHRLTWDGRDDGGQSLPSGVYFARLRTVGGAETVKLTLVR